MSESVKSGLQKAYRYLLVPLVRILIRHQVSAAEITEVMRQVYVDVASNEFKLPGRKQSDMRISILTGLTRKEVHRLRHDKPSTKESSNLSRVARVLSGWNQDPDFTGPYGLPLDLPFERPVQGKATFTELVRRHSGDMSPRAMLDELIRVRAAEQTDDGFIKVTGRAYIPVQLDPASLERLGQVIHYIVDTLDYNTREENKERLRFERTVKTDVGISLEDYGEFQDLIRQKGQELLEVLDNWLGSHEISEGDASAANKTIKTGVGIFHFEEPNRPPSGGD